MEELNSFDDMMKGADRDLKNAEQVRTLIAIHLICSYH